jgi:hypothetical protein
MPCPPFVGAVLVRAFSKARHFFDYSTAKGYGQFKIVACSTVGVSALTALPVVVAFVGNEIMGVLFNLMRAAADGYRRRPIAPRCSVAKLPCSPRH